LRTLLITICLALLPLYAGAQSRPLPDAPVPEPVQFSSGAVPVSARMGSINTGAPSSLADEEQVPDSPELTMFPHSNTARYWISGQLNIISQGKPCFHSSYQGPNSLDSAPEDATSVLNTLFLGWQAIRNLRYETDLLLDFEEAGGGGIGQALGLAGFTNLDVVRNPTLGKAPYLARAEIHQTVGLTSQMTESDRGPFSLATEVPARRIEIRVGK